jgi:hypothetical protein
VISQQRAPSRDKTLVALCFGLALFVSPARALWTSPRAPWWAPYALWAALIATAFAGARSDAEPPR